LRRSWLIVGIETMTFRSSGDLCRLAGGSRFRFWQFRGPIQGKHKSRNLRSGGYGGDKAPCDCLDQNGF
jgi:hypothetical protein